MNVPALSLALFWKHVRWRYVRFIEALVFESWEQQIGLNIYSCAFDTFLLKTLILYFKVFLYEILHIKTLPKQTFSSVFVHRAPLFEKKETRKLFLTLNFSKLLLHKTVIELHVWRIRVGSVGEWMLSSVCSSAKKNLKSASEQKKPYKVRI